MLYGTKYLRWAQFAKETPEPEGALPKYQAAISVGSIAKLDEKPSFSEAKGYGDNGQKVSVNEFQEGVIDIDVTDLTNEVASKMLGAKLDNGEPGPADLHYNSEDNAPYGGLAYYINTIDDNNVKGYQGIFYPKTKASPVGETHSTKGKEISLAPQSLHLLATAPKNGDWKIKSERFATEAEAKEWVDNKLKDTSSMGG